MGLCVTHLSLERLQSSGQGGPGGGLGLMAFLDLVEDIFSFVSLGLSGKFDGLSSSVSEIFCDLVSGP